MSSEDFVLNILTYVTYKGEAPTRQVVRKPGAYGWGLAETRTPTPHTQANKRKCHVF